jgi:zinc transporter ZupT
VIVLWSALIFTFLGVWLGSLPTIARRLASLNGGLLIGIATFWILPEVATNSNWSTALAWLAGGFALLFAIDRYIEPVCSTCTHAVSTVLLVAAAAHCFLDGWLIQASLVEGQSHLTAGIIAGIVLHKIPEGLALGVMLRSALKSERKAMLASAAFQLVTWLGIVAEGYMSPFIAPGLVQGLLALTGGGFLFLGYHAVHRAAPVFGPAFAGAVGAALVGQGLRLFAR